jgi:hypothetical protein
MKLIRFPFHIKSLFCILVNAVSFVFGFGEQNQHVANLKGPETVSFFDGSSLLGSLHAIQDADNLIWNHKSSKNHLAFDYKAVESILFNREEKQPRKACWLDGDPF